MKTNFTFLPTLLQPITKKLANLDKIAKLQLAAYKYKPLTNTLH